MVLISEITDDGVAEEAEGPKEEAMDEDKESSDKGRESPEMPAKSPVQVSEPPSQEVESAAADGDDGPAAVDGDDGPAAYNECAMRVAYIMRSYFFMRQKQAASQVAAAPAAGEVTPAERCKAMMEVVRKEPGRWVVSKLTTEHNHAVDPARREGPTPSIGMAFDTVEAAKIFYYGYAERSGFKPRTGSNRRSAGSGALIMQRFLCWRGNYLMYRKLAPDSEATKRKRGPYKKRARRLEDEAAAEMAKQSGSASLDVIDVESSAERGGPTAPADDAGTAEVQSSGQEKQAASVDKDMKQSAVAPVADPSPAAVGIGVGKAPQVAVTPESRLLRELGIRVSRYTNEERRDIILKYMMKRNNRQGAERPMKVTFRQALAGKRQRGVGGKFLSRDIQASNGQEKNAETEADDPMEDVADLGGEPKVGMVFANEDKAYEFYVKYAGKVGFSVRKGWWDKSARNVTRSRVYVCSREGFRPKNTVNEAKKPRSETRTGCPARLAIRITSNGKYRVTEFVADHNHELAAPLDIQMLRSQRLLAKTQSSSPQNACLIPADYKNYLRAKRMKDMQPGDAGAILEYLQKMKGENPSFFYAIQVDEDDQLTNIFWVDARSQMDYYYFGDVVCFDTTYKINEYGRPFAQFLGVNHHKQTAFFGAALLYDETVDSFKWLFETFKAAMCGKQPKTILTDQCLAVGEAVAAVWPGTNHRLCVWHVYQNATKQLSDVFQGSESLFHDLRKCLYDFEEEEEEEEFLSEWQAMLEKHNLTDHEWLVKLFKDREKWALVYGRHAFSADMKSTLLSENFSTLLKELLSQETDLLCFFKQYGTLMDERRCAEQEADYHANGDTPRTPPLRLLWQAANAYTPAVYEMFRMEFDLFMNCMVYCCRGDGTDSVYEVTVKEKTKGHIVRLDSSNGTLTCTCKKFEFIGVQCCHALKVLDFRNFKELPPQYILKRWRKDAKAGSIREIHGFALDSDAKSSLAKRYSSLCRILYKIAARAAENFDAYAFLESQSDQLLEQVERILQTRLLEKASPNNASKSQQQNPVQCESENHDNNSDSQRASGKKKKDAGVRRKHQTGLEMNKRQKGRKGQPDEAEVTPRSNQQPVLADDIPSHPRNPSNQFFASGHFVQGSYIPAHQFELGPVQGFHGMTQFSQVILDKESSATALQQPFSGSTQLSQNFVQASSNPDGQSSQFVAGNPQLDQQSSEQGHYTIPVWDFL